MKKRLNVWRVLGALAILIGLPIWFYYTFVFGDYMHRAQASEAISLMGGAKTPLSEYFEDRKKWPGKLEEVAGSTSGKYTQSVVISKGAGGTGELELTATMRAERVDSRIAGHTIRLFSIDGGKSWTCRPGTMSEKNLPSTCRN